MSRRGSVQTVPLQPLKSRPEPGKTLITILILSAPGAQLAFRAVRPAPPSGALQNVELKRLWTQEEITSVRQTASKLRGAYKPPGKRRQHAPLPARNPQRV